jgi:hypothetical protein
MISPPVLGAWRHRRGERADAYDGNRHHPGGVGTGMESRALYIDFIRYF